MREFPTTQHQIEVQRALRKAYKASNDPEFQAMWLSKIEQHQFPEQYADMMMEEKSNVDEN